MTYPSTLLVTIDSLRYDTATDLMLRTQSQLNTWHDAAFAACPATMGSVPSILSGDRPQDAGLPSGASVWTEFGCETIGVTTNRLLAASYGYDDGMDTYHAPPSASDSKSITTRVASFLDTGTAAYEVASRVWSGVQKVQDTVIRRSPGKSYPPAEDVIDEFSGLIPESEPWAGWVHLMDPHHPYNPHDETRVEDQAATRRLLNGKGTDDDASRAQDRYRDEVRAVDKAVSRLLNAVPDSTRVIVTADHGECLGEAGVWGHPGTLRPETLRVPFGTRNISIDSSVISLSDVPAYLVPDRTPPSRDLAVAAYGDSLAVCNSEAVVSPDGAYSLDGAEIETPGPLARKRSRMSGETVTLEDGNEADLAALGYI